MIEGNKAQTGITEQNQSVADEDMCENIEMNTQGAGKAGFRGACRHLLTHNKVDVLTLVEPRISGRRADKVCARLNFSESIRVECTGFARGIWMPWNVESIKLSVLTVHNNFIHLGYVHLVVVYAPPAAHRRVQFWADFEEEVKLISTPLFIGGDFNYILSIEERQGGMKVLSSDTRTFVNWVNNLELIDMGATRSKYTWNRGKSTTTRISKRLDRVFVNLSGRLRWQEAYVQHLAAVCSDHNPLLLQLTSANAPNRARKPFHFEAAWILHPSFLDFVDSSWEHSLHAYQALDKLKWELKEWNQRVFGNIYRRKSALIARIDGIQRAIENKRTSSRLIELQNSYTLAQQEKLWFQKSRESWIELGDRNTKFFHASTVIRRRKNRISALRNAKDEWVEDQGELETMATNFFKQLYSLPPAETDFHPLVGGGFSNLEQVETNGLDIYPSDEEIWEAVRKMGSYKASEIDGF
ncbi:hypothetical protein V2J09_003632 [Rumex salicifolius]